MKMTRTWDSTMSMIPRGGDTIWGGLDWSPEEGHLFSKRKQSTNNTQLTGQQTNKTNVVNYGRIISFGRDVAEAHSSEIEMMDFRVSLFLTLKLEIDVVFPCLSFLSPHILFSFLSKNMYAVYTQFLVNRMPLRVPMLRIPLVAMCGPNTMTWELRE